MSEPRLSIFTLLKRPVPLCAAVVLFAACGSAATTANTPPMAFAGFDQDAVVGGAVSLDGTASGDPDGDALSYIWTLEFAPPGSSAALPDDQAQAPMPAFVPDVEGVYLFGLVVSDGSYASLKDLVAVTVSAAAE